MLDFSSIPLHLQIGIAEKIDYFDQREFELSSKRGKDAINFTTHKAVVTLECMRCWDNDIQMFFILNHVYPKDGRRQKNCSELLQFPHLPRFKVKEIVFNWATSISPLIEMCGRQLFVENEVYLDWCWKGNKRKMRNGVPDFSTLSDVFLKYFNVTGLYLSAVGPIDKSLFALPEIRKMRRIFINSPETPDDIFLQLQTGIINLYNRTENRISVTANLFLKEWFAKKRCVEWFNIETKYDAWSGTIKEEIVFSGLPYSIIWKNSEDQKNTSLKFLKYRGRIDLYYFDNWKVNENTTVYSIDRGDSKLAVVVIPGLGGREVLVAQECTQLDDVIRISVKGVLSTACSKNGRCCIG